MANEKLPVAGDDLTALIIVELTYEPEYVIGLPFYVGFTLVPKVDGSYRGLPQADFLDLGGSIGMRLWASQHGREIAFAPSPIPVDAVGASRGVFHLATREKRRMLVDLSPLLPMDLAPGVYHLRVVFVAPRSSAESDSITVKLRTPTDADRDRLRQFAPDRARFRDWSEWIQGPPLDPKTLTAPLTASDPLRFAVILRRLLHGPDPLPAVDPNILSPLTGVYEPEGLALRAELLHARGATAEYRKTRDLVLTRYPGLNWWIRSIEEGDGQIAWRRSK